MANIADQPINEPLDESRGGTDATSFTHGKFIYYNSGGDGALESSAYDSSSFATASHYHAAGDITSGVLAIAQGGTYRGTGYVNNKFLVFDGSQISSSSYDNSSFAAATHYHSAEDITSGALDVDHGGTNLSTIAAGSILAANALDTLTAITSTSGTLYLKNVDGTISWAAVGGGTPAGANYYVQYYADASFGAEAAFNYNPSTNVLAVENLNLAAAGNIQCNSVNTKRTVMLTAGGGMPATTSGCAQPAQIEFATNDVDVICLAFDPSSIEYAVWNIAMPDNWDGSTITVWFYYFTSATSGTVLFDICGRCYGDGDALDADLTSSGWSEGSADTVPGSAYSLAVSDSATFTPANAADKGYTVLKVRRDTGTDTCANDACLAGVKLEYGINAFSD